VAGLAQVQGLWQFDDTLANQVTGGAPLNAIGFIPAYVDETIGGNPARVISLPALTPAQRLDMPVTGGANGGGAATRVNQWSLVMDVKVNLPSFNTYGSLFSTRLTGTTDTDGFVAPAGELAVNGGQSTAHKVLVNTWQRIAFTCGNDGSGGALVVKAYIDSTLVFSSGALPLDEDYALDALAYLFTDDNGETLPLLCNNVAFWRETLSAADITMLGGPEAGGLRRFMVANSLDSGAGSMRQAIADAAAFPGTDLIAFSPTAFPAVTRAGSPGAATGTGPNPLTGYTVPAGNNRALVVATAHESLRPSDGVSFGGTPMVLVTEVTNGSTTNSIWVLPLGSSVAPSIGNLAFGRASLNGVQTILATSFTNVDQAKPMESAEKSTNTGTIGSLVPATRPGDLAYDFFDTTTPGLLPATLHPGPGQTRIHSASAVEAGSGVRNFGTSTRPASLAITTTGWIAPAGNLLHAAASIRAASVIVPTATHDINDPGGLIIDASDLPEGITLDGNKDRQIFCQRNGSSTLTLRHLNLTRGNGTGPEADTTGGAILNHLGTLVMENCVLTGNSAGASGGSLRNAGTARISRCTLALNSAGTDGGAIDQNGGTLEISRSTISENFAEISGGGISSDAPVTLEHCTITRNTARSTGGGISNRTPMVCANSIVSGNFKGIEDQDVTNTNAVFTRAGANLIGVFANVSAGSDTGPAAGPAPALLAPTGEYGGATPTIALMSGSPARDASVGSASLIDQRGLPMVGNADIGAYEAGNDSAYTAWAWETLPGNLTPFEHEPWQDLDSDGATNLVEYLAMTNPVDASSYFRVTSLIASGADELGNHTAIVTFPTAVGRSYTVQFSLDMTSWTTREVVTGTGFPVTSSVVINWPRGFVRVRVSR